MVRTARESGSSKERSAAFRSVIERFDRTVNAIETHGKALHEIGTMLLIDAQDPNSVDACLTQSGLQMPFDSASHHLLYESWTAAMSVGSLIGSERILALIGTIVVPASNARKKGYSNERRPPSFLSRPVAH